MSEIIEEMKREAFEKGYREGYREGFILGFISVYLDFNFSDSQIIKSIITEIKKRKLEELSKEEALKYLEQVKLEHKKVA